MLKTRFWLVGPILLKTLLVCNNEHFLLCVLHFVFSSYTEEQLNLRSKDTSSDLTSAMFAMSYNPSLVHINLEKYEDAGLEEYSDEGENWSGSVD